MLKLFKVTTITSIATLTYILVGVIRAKFTALTLGPSGVGIFSQALNFQQLIITISSLSINLGVTKYVSKYNAADDPSKTIGIISCAFWMQAIASFALIALTLLFSGTFSKLLFSRDGYGIYIFIATIGIPFFVLASTGESVLFGFGNYKAFTKARSYSSALSLVPLFIFISLMNVNGGFIYLAVNGALTFCVYLYILDKNLPKNLLKEIFSIKNLTSMRRNLREFGKNLLSYGGVSFGAGIIGMINIVFLRSLLIKHLGTEASGYYQVVFALSAYYLTFFTNGLWSYFYPKMSSIEKKSEHTSEINNAFRFCFFGAAISVTALFLFRHWIINLLFSGKFASSGELFATELFGDLFYLLSYIMATSLLASAKLKSYLAFNLIYSACYVGFFVLLLKPLGLKAITTSYLLANLIQFSALLYYHVKKMEFRLYKENALLIASGVIIGGCILFLGRDGTFVFIAKALLLTLWLYLMSMASEKKKIIDIIKNRSKAILGSYAG